MRAPRRARPLRMARFPRSVRPLRTIKLMRRRPCSHIRHYVSGKRTLVNPHIHKGRQITQAFIIGCAKDFITEKMQTGNYDLSDAGRIALKNATVLFISSQLSLPPAVVSPFVEVALKQVFH